MVKVSESAIKTVKADKRKWLARLNQTVLEVGRVIACGLSWSVRLPVDSRHLTQRTPEVERGNPVCLPDKGQRAARRAHGCAGLGGRKKRMPGCNGSDTGFKVTRHESGPTSDWSFVVREYAEPWV